jgi:hypothetical protein
MSELMEAHEELELKVRLANTKPIELVDLGQSFEALAELTPNLCIQRATR